MSKAMDALEYIKQRIAWCPEHEKCPSCRDTESNLAALRDYITTTEAERAASDELEPGDPIASGCCPSCGIHIDVLAGEDEGEVVAVGTNDAGFSRESYWIDHGEPPAKAARIKELEEANNRLAKLFETDPHQFSTRPCFTCAGITSLTGRLFGCDRRRKEDADYRAAKKAISGARKVHSLGSVRGDEHLGAMLPDDGARKVEP